MPLLKRGSDGLTNGLVFGAIMGVLFASSNISFISNIVTQVMNFIPSQYISWAGAYASYAVFGVLGLLVGWIIDYY